MIIRVQARPGRSAAEEPLSFFMGEREVRVLEVLDRWRGADHDYLKLRGGDSCTYIIRHDFERDDWELVMMESG